MLGIKGGLLGGSGIHRSLSFFPSFLPSFSLSLVCVVYICRYLALLTLLPALPLPISSTSASTSLPHTASVWSQSYRFSPPG